jgi:isoleucyl-tRNA synthetase
VKVDHTVVDERLMDQMALARSIASLGLSARNTAGIKVRQPLGEVLVYVRQGRSELGEEMIAIVADELNIKRFAFVKEARELIQHRILPNNKLLGPRFGARFPQVRQALNLLDPETIAGLVEKGEQINLDLGEERVTLSPEEIIVETLPLEGMAIAEDKATIVAVNIQVTPELRSEGLAREVVRRVQAMRKNADFNIEDRITMYYVADKELAEAFQTWGGYIQAETLTTALVPDTPPESFHTETHTIDGMQITIGVNREI